MSPLIKNTYFPFKFALAVMALFCAALGVSPVSAEKSPVLPDKVTI